MKRAVRKTRAAPTPESEDAARLEALLGKFALLMVENGYPPKQLSQAFAAACSKLREPKHARDPSRPAFTADLVHVISYWYTDPLYVDGRGKPRPLPAKGPGLSVADLVRRANRKLDPDVAIETLVKHRALKLRGTMYVPTDRKVMFDPKDAAAPARGLLPLEGLLDTLLRNWASGRKGAELFEATAINPAFPTKRVRALKKYLADRGLAFLNQADSSMRQDEARATEKELRTRIGVSVFVFEEAPAAAKTSSAKRKRAGR